MKTDPTRCPECGNVLVASGDGKSVCPQCQPGQPPQPSVRIRLLRPEGLGEVKEQPQPSPFAQLEAAVGPEPPRPPRPAPPPRFRKAPRPFGPRDESDLLEYHSELDRQRPVDPDKNWLQSQEPKYRFLRFGLKVGLVGIGSLILKSGVFFAIGLAVLVIADLVLPLALGLLREGSGQEGERVVVKNTLSVPVRVDYRGKYLGKGSERVGPNKTVELNLERGATVTVVDERTNEILHVDSIQRSTTIVVGQDRREA